MDDNAPPASQLWTPSGSKHAYSKAGTDSNFVDLLANHSRYPPSRKTFLVKKQNLKCYIESIMYVM